jgi:hypothetical protein
MMSVLKQNQIFVINLSSNLKCFKYRDLYVELDTEEQGLLLLTVQQLISFTLWHAFTHHTWHCGASDVIDRFAAVQL